MTEEVVTTTFDFQPDHPQAEPEPQPEPEEEEVPVEEVVPAVEPEEQALYQVGTWHDLPLFKCPQCAHRVVKRTAAEGQFEIDDHIGKLHPSSWLEGV